MNARSLGWIAIIRLGLVQTALGAIVVLTTSTLNRVMVVELALPAMLPGALVGLHYAVQLSRPRWGYGSDMGGRRTPWIVGGMAVLALGGIAAASATALMAATPWLGIAAAVLAFTAIGAGVGAAGTSLLALLATRVAPERRAAAASIVWIMMIAGFAVTATVAGGLLEPFSLARLIAVTAAVSTAAFALTLIALWGVERKAAAPMPLPPASARTPFMTALKEVWGESRARRFTVFVFVSMLAYSAQDLILEPFAGVVFGLTPGESTKLAGVQHSGVLAGMVVVAAGASLFGRSRQGLLRLWTVGGCIASALALFALAVSGSFAPAWPLKPSVFALGAANGVFAVAAIGSMMALAGQGREGREGTRMGLWGAAQAIAFGLGGFLGTVAIDITRALFDAPATAYGLVFAAEAVLFIVAARLALGIRQGAAKAPPEPQTSPVAQIGDGFMAGAGGR